jgi:transcriptional regulator with XRE-family HTH domain
VKKRTDKPFADELPGLLKERGLSLRKLARQVGVGDDHLSRVVRGARAKKPTADLARRVATALQLPTDYFPETRLDFIVQQLARDPALLDATYDRIRRTASKGRSKR